MLKYVFFSFLVVFLHFSVFAETYSVVNQDFTIKPSSLYLKDIINIKGKNADFIISDHFLPGQKRILYITNINALLKAKQIPVILKSEYSAITVTRKIGKLDNNMLKNLLSEKLCLPLEPDDSVEISIEKRKLRIPADISSIEIISKPVIGSQMLKLIVHSPDGSSVKAYIPAKIYVYRKCSVATANIKRGEKLSKSSWNRKYIKLRTVQDLERIRLIDPTGYVASRDIRKGSVLKNQYLKLPFSVKSGSQVTIIKSIGTLTIKLKGTAMENGSIGQIIRIRNSRSGKIISAKVTGTSLVTAN